MLRQNKGLAERTYLNAGRACYGLNGRRILARITKLPKWNFKMSDRPRWPRTLGLPRVILQYIFTKHLVSSTSRVAQLVERQTFTTVGLRDLNVGGSRPPVGDLFALAFTFSATAFFLVGSTRRKLRRQARRLLSCHDPVATRVCGNGCWRGKLKVSELCCAFLKRGISPYFRPLQQARINSPYSIESLYSWFSSGANSHSGYT